VGEAPALGRTGSPSGSQRREGRSGSSSSRLHLHSWRGQRARRRARGVPGEPAGGFSPGYGRYRRTDRGSGNYPGKGGGEKGAWFRDGEGNLIGIGQPVR
jgi:hypothetical protein